jgi:hypothetical protein
MKDVRRGMTDVELVEELNRLENLDELSRCDEMRRDIVYDELVCRQSKYPNSGHSSDDTVTTCEASDLRTTHS